jgi:cytidine deaminase
MKKHSIHLEYTEYDGNQGLQPEQISLLEQAFAACSGAYAPYSLFRVGAAVELNTGEIVVGSNQENMAFPSGLCAERVAVFAAMANYPGSTIRRIAISTDGERKTSSVPAAPCGSCRQALLEYELNQEYEIELILGTPGQKVRVIQGIQHLLPLHFNEPGLRKSR